MVVILSQNVLHEVFNTGLLPRQVAWEHLLTFFGYHELQGDQDVFKYVNSDNFCEYRSLLKLVKPKLRLW